MQHDSDQGAADILIPVRNHYPYTRTLIEGIYRHTDYPFHIYIIDNASTDETVDLHKIYTRDITIVRNRRSRGWSGAINQGIQLGSNPYLVFMRNDIELAHGWLGNMIAFLRTHPRIAAVGPLDSNKHDWQCVDRVRETMVRQMPHFFTGDIHERNRILQYHYPNAGILVDGALAFFCTVFTRRAITEVGLLESNRIDGDSDYCRRLRKSGYVLGLALDTYVIRHSSGVHKTAAGRRRVAARRHNAASGRR
jgi:GT2 family glycosyltransferase